MLCIQTIEFKRLVVCLIPDKGVEQSDTELDLIIIPYIIILYEIII